MQRTDALFEVQQPGSWESRLGNGGKGERSMLTRGLGLVLRNVLLGGALTAMLLGVGLPAAAKNGNWVSMTFRLTRLG
jgi:hypothetical protein